MANKRNGTIYTGVTSNLLQRDWQHKNKLADGFTKRYECSLLVYYEACENMEQAILREKQIKGGSRAKKIAMIESVNPEWLDLSSTLWYQAGLLRYARDDNRVGEAGRYGGAEIVFPLPP